MEDLYGLAKIGEDQLMDSDFNLQNILVDSFSRTIAEAEDLAFIKGAAYDSEQPEGITTNASLIANTITTTAAGAVTIEEFLEMVCAVPANSERVLHFWFTP